MNKPDLRELVESNFAFLMDRHGYSRTENRAHFVRYESASTLVQIAFDGYRSYELDLSIGELESKEPPFSLIEILHLQSPSDVSTFSDIHVSTQEEMALWLERFAKILSDKCSDVISGNKQSLVELMKQRDVDVRCYALEREERSERGNEDGRFPA